MSWQVVVVILGVLASFVALAVISAWSGVKREQNAIAREMLRKGASGPN